MKYRLDLWLKPDLGSDQVKKELKDLEEELAKNSGGQPVLSFGSQTKKKLAYKIKGLSEGYFLTANLEVVRFDPGFLTFLNRRPNVLRYLLTRLPMQSSKFKV